MSGASHLPPRIPVQKVCSRQVHELNLFSTRKVHESGSRHHRSYSHNSSLEDQPAWLDDLLSESDSIPKRAFHCRSASDSLTLFHGVGSSMGVSESGDEEQSNSESGCLYGPNSPRRKSSVGFSDSNALMALSKYVAHDPVQFVDETSKNSRNLDFDQRKGCYVAFNEPGSEQQPGKRHPGQRSRARKLQYIAELERTVNVFQALESELAVKISTLLQQRAALSMENSKLKRQMTRVQQQKLKMDGEYQNLKKEADRLKLSLASSLIGNTPHLYAGSSSDTNTNTISWQTLDWEKLHL